LTIDKLSIESGFQFTFSKDDKDQLNYNVDKKDGDDYSVKISKLESACSKLTFELEHTKSNEIELNSQLS